jgi:Phage integrase, N-terminal SAM-like domain
MVAEEYLGRSRLFRHLKSGPHGQLVELYAARLVNEGLARHGTWRCLSLVGALLSWMGRSRSKLTDLDERTVERYLRHRAGKPGDWAALKRLLFVLREAGTIAPAMQPPLTPHEQVFEAFSQYLQEERGLATKSIIHHLPFIRLFLREVCPGGASDLGRISQADVIHYVERHARDRSAQTGKAMCWALRSFLRYLHYKGLNPLALAGCVPSIRRWKLASLPTYLSAAQVQKVLDDCDRTTALGQRDYAILMMLAKLGLRAGEVATLTLEDRLAIRRDARSRQGSAASEDTDASRCRRGCCDLPA